MNKLDKELVNEDVKSGMENIRRNTESGGNATNVKVDFSDLKERNKLEKERLEEERNKVFTIDLFEEPRNFRTTDYRETLDTLRNRNCLALKDLYYMNGNRKVNMNLKDLEVRQMNGILGNTAKVIATRKDHFDLEKARINHRIAIASTLTRETGYIKLDKLTHQSNQLYLSSLSTLKNDKEVYEDVVFFDIDTICSNAVITNFLKENDVLLKTNRWVVSITHSNVKYAVYYLRYLQKELNIKDAKDVVVAVVNERSNEASLLISLTEDTVLKNINEENVNRNVQIKGDNQEVVDLINSSYEQYVINTEIYNERFKRNKKKGPKIIKKSK